ncbi:MAG: sugar ABC transporter ATP-binding protein [Armatimonadetes bacterium]|nr:sugar ABC transporter ATP-binding protein [Armatimonadota bacterium]
MTPHGDIALLVRGVSKKFPGVQALDRVDFELRAGEVHALVGENGAGKSTLVKILTGALARDAGEILVFGERVELRSPREALKAGIAAIFQEFNLVPYLTVAENIFLGREPRRRAGLIDWPRLYRRAREVLAQIAAPIDPRRVVAELSVAGQQMVEIAKALSVGARILIMDEPSAALTEEDLAALFRRIRSLKAQGVSIVYISHRLSEIFQVADRATVLRDGRVVGQVAVAEVDEPTLVGMMVGRQVRHGVAAPARPPGPPALSARNVSSAGLVRNCSLDVRAGEIVGIAGLVGSGRTELARAIFGAAPRFGEVRVGGRLLPPNSPRAAISAGLGLLPEDRKLQGLLLQMLVRENITLTNLRAVSAAGFVRRRAEDAAARELIRRLDIRPPEPARRVLHLSGGNQQKVVLAKWLFSRCRVLILDEPTRGVDVGAKAEIHRLMRQLTDEGAAILMISSELPEILSVADRILVMREGRIVGELSREDATEQAIMMLATGTRASGHAE